MGAAVNGRARCRAAFSIMALKSTIYKINLNVSDMDRGYYAEHALTVARHPSENDERMMVRVLAFAMHASEDLRFGRGLSTEDEADLYEPDLTGAIRLWIDVGLPDEKLVRKAAARADRVVVVTYGRTAVQWWEQSKAAFARLRNLTVVRLATADTQALAGLAQRALSLQCIVNEQQVWLGDDGAMLQPAWVVVQGGER
jgi:uncharacterized protein YaeQ